MAGDLFWVQVLVSSIPTTPTSVYTYLMQCTPEQKKALEALAFLGSKLGSGWKVKLATRWGKDQETGLPRLEEEIVLNTEDIRTLADLKF